jgi:hypothetical protein
MENKELITEALKSYERNHQIIFRYIGNHVTELVEKMAKYYESKGITMDSEKINDLLQSLFIGFSNMQADSFVELVLKPSGNGNAANSYSTLMRTSFKRIKETEPEPVQNGPTSDTGSTIDNNVREKALKYLDIKGFPKTEENIKQLVDWYNERNAA